MNFVYIRAKNITAIRIYDESTPTLVGSVDEPGYTVTTQQGRTSDYQIDGYAHYLIAVSLLPYTKYRTTNKLKIDVTGINREIYEIACLYSEPQYRLQAEPDAEVDEAQLVRFDIQPTLRGYASRQDFKGELDFIPPLNSPPIRFSTDFGITYDAQNQKANTDIVFDKWQQLLTFFSENRSGFALVQEYGRYPCRIYTKAGLYPNFEIAVQRVIEDMKRYDNIYFTVAEA